MAPSHITWDWGTAYDLFISLWVLHEPANFGVRGAWAAGVRARLPASERELLEQAQSLLHVPLHWIYQLPQPKDSETVLWTLGQIPPAERLPALTLGPDTYSDETRQLLTAVAEGASWDDRDREALRTALLCDGKKEKYLSPEKLALILDWWSRTEEFGERYLEALRLYHEVFFAEEEQRIRPALKAALARGQELAEKLALPDLLEDLSQGVRLDDLAETDRVVLAPSFWCTPLIFFGQAEENLRLLMYGARPPDASLVPGEVVPDALLRVLKAISDPTRLRILHYLTKEPQPPAQLARRLRLRAPTVTHHLKTLRLAGLVQVTVGEGKEHKVYATRSEAVAAACDSLKRFLTIGDVQE